MRDDLVFAMTGPADVEWSVAGSYFEACNCTAVCPCRRVGERDGGRSSYGVCQFALSWQIGSGHAGAVTLDGLAVVMAGWYDDDEAHSPWRVCLYVDDRAEDAQFVALSSIFLGRAGGTTFANFAQAIGAVHAVRRAAIALDHRPRRWRIAAGGYVAVTASRPVDMIEPVSCGIPGHDRHGLEVVSTQLVVTDDPLGWDVREKCGFASDFSYSS